MKPSRRAYEAGHLRAWYKCCFGFLGAGLHAEGGVTGTEVGAARRNTSDDLAFEPPAWPGQAFRLWEWRWVREPSKGRLQAFCTSSYSSLWPRFPVARLDVINCSAHAFPPSPVLFLLVWLSSSKRAIKYGRYGTIYIHFPFSFSLDTLSFMTAPRPPAPLAPWERVDDCRCLVPVYGRPGSCNPNWNPTSCSAPGERRSGSQPVLINAAFSLSRIPDHAPLLAAPSQGGPKMPRSVGLVQLGAGSEALVSAAGLSPCPSAGGCQQHPQFSSLVETASPVCLLCCRSS